MQWIHQTVYPQMQITGFNLLLLVQPRFGIGMDVTAQTAFPVSEAEYSEDSFHLMCVIFSKK